MRSASHTFGFLALTILLHASNARAQDVIHLVRPGTQTKNAAAPELVGRRIAGAAREYQQYAPIPRAAFFDMAYPADTGEYRRMAGYGLLLVTAISQAEDELPVKPYVRTSAGDVPLQMVTSVVGGAQADDSIVRRVFGPNRVDALYLVPLHGDALGADLFVDFAKNRQGFKLGTIGATLPASLQRGAGLPSGGEPPPAAVLRMIEREYPGFVAPP